MFEDTVPMNSKSSLKISTEYASMNKTNSNQSFSTIRQYQ